MKSFGQYFKYHFRSTFLRLIIMMAIVLLLSAINFEDTVRITLHRTTKEFVGSNVYLGFYTTLFAVLCSIIPIFELYVFKSRRNLDTMFTLPVSRTKMLFAHLLNGWIHIMLAYIAEGLIIFTALYQKRDWVNENYFWKYYLGLLVVGLAVYLFFSFVFSQGNTIIDGMVFMAAWIFAFVMPFVVANDIIRYLDKTYVINSSLLNWIDRIIDSTTVYSPFNNITILLSDFMEIKDPSSTFIYYMDLINLYKIEANIAVAFLCVVGIVSFVLLYFTFKKQRVEKVEDISNSPIGYKFLIPFYVISFMLVEYDPLMVVICVIGMLVAYIIYRRTFRIKKWDIIMIGITILIGIALGIVEYVDESMKAAEAAAQLCGNVFQYMNL